MQNYNFFFFWSNANTTISSDSEMKQLSLEIRLGIYAAFGLAEGWSREAMTFQDLGSLFDSKAKIYFFIGNKPKSSKKVASHCSSLKTESPSRLIDKQ